MQSNQPFIMMIHLSLTHTHIHTDTDTHTHTHTHTHAHTYTHTHTLFPLLSSCLCRSGSPLFAGNGSSSHSFNRPSPFSKGGFSSWGDWGGGELSLCETDNIHVKGKSHWVMIINSFVLSSLVDFLHPFFHSLTGFSS